MIVLLTSFGAYAIIDIVEGKVGEMTLDFVWTALTTWDDDHSFVLGAAYAWAWAAVLIGGSGLLRRLYRRFFE